jgi:hypothetical protein
MITIQKDTISGQSKGCFLCVQIRFTRILFRRFWNPSSDKQGLHIYIAAPRHNPDTGYHCKRYGVNRLCIG